MVLRKKRAIELYLTTVALLACFLPANLQAAEVVEEYADCNEVLGGPILSNMSEYLNGKLGDELSINFISGLFDNEIKRSSCTKDQIDKFLLENNFHFERKIRGNAYSYEYQSEWMNYTVFLLLRWLGIGLKGVTIQYDENNKFQYSSWGVKL